MTEEIKELLSIVSEGQDSIQRQQLVNYITNLQKENQSLKEELKYTIPQVEHNQIVSKLCREKQDYKSRNEKAIEYIKQHCDRPGRLLLPKIDFNYNDLLNILEGGDE